MHYLVHKSDTIIEARNLKDVTNFVVNAVPAVGLAPLGARTSADIMMTKF